MLAMRARFCRLPCLGAALLLLGGGSPARSERLPLPALLQGRVNHAIDRGVGFLITNEGPWGSWTADPKSHPVGYAALPGLTLLECGEARDHPGILMAASFVRQNCAKLDNTYDLSLAVLFLDRLGDPADEKLIQSLALRLIAGQSFTGGWSYRCPILNAQQAQQLLAGLRINPKSPLPAPATVSNLPVFHPASRVLLGDPQGKSHDSRGTTDNSNSQFAMLALWAVRRHGVPMDRTLRLIAQRFKTSQNRDGSWGYHYSYGGGDPERPSMTCVGLLGLAIGHGLAADIEARENPAVGLERIQAAAVVVFHPQLAFLLLGLQQTEKMQLRERAKKRASDGTILNGFVALHKHVGEPAGRMEEIRQHDLYFLWSMERVAVLYDLPTIGHKDWYRWGSEMLVANQKAGGNWENGGYHGNNPIIDTCLALLFLKRANLVADLTTRLPFDPGALTSSIKAQVRPPTAESPPSLADSQKDGTLKAIGTVILQTPGADSRSAVQDLTKPEAGPFAQVDSPPASEESETPAKSEWLWLLVTIASLLFVLSGVLLTRYSLARDKGKKQPQRSRLSKGRLREPRRPLKRM
jgi:hypothetical protein